MKHIGMTGDGVNDAPALENVEFGVVVADADAADGASDIVLTKPGTIFQSMKNYATYAASIAIHIVFGFMPIALGWKFDFSPFMVLIIVILDGIIMIMSKDIVKPSLLSDGWKLKEIFATGIVLGGYLALCTILFFSYVHDTILLETFGVRNIKNSEYEMIAALYLQVSIVSQALIFVTRSRNCSLSERPGLLLMTTVVIAQLVATLVAVYANWRFARIKGCGWGWACIIWIYDIVLYLTLDPLKLMILHFLSGHFWEDLQKARGVA